jgi:hypothetical protein
MKKNRTALRIIVTVALILLPLILVALTLEPLERSPARSSRNTQVITDNPQDAPGDDGPATPTS